MLLILTFVACESENNIVDTCEQVNDLLVCHQATDYVDAEYHCANYNSVLVDTNSEETIDYTHQEYVAAIGVVAFNDVMWWSGLDVFNSGNTCTAQIQEGGWVPRACSEQHPYICQLFTD